MKVKLMHVKQGSQTKIRQSHHYSVGRKTKQIILDYMRIFFCAIFELNKRGRLHGVDHVINTKYHPFERLLWFVLVISTIFSGYFIGKRQMQRYNANPTVISLDRDFRAWNGTIPAITFCYHKRIDDVKARNLIKRIWNVEPTDLEYKHFMDYVNLVANTTIYSFKAFSRYVGDKRLEYVDMGEIAKQIIPNINAIISSFDPNFNPTIEEIMTERGICHTANGILASSLLNTKKKGMFNMTSLEVTKCPYHSIQCYVQLEVLDPTIEYTIHSPYDIVTQNSFFIQVGPTDEIENTYDIQETIASEKLKSLTLAQRKCLFYDESITNFIGYSQNICRLVYRAEAAQEMCGCHPHFYSFINGTSCSPSGLYCLSINFWPENIKYKYECPKTCSDLVYTQNIYRKTNWAENGEYSIVSNKSIIKFEILPQKIRYRRDLLFSFEDLIVSFGGIAALFIGCNLWNIARMLYFILTIAIKYFYRNLYIPTF